MIDAALAERGKRKRLSDIDIGFYAGVACALAVVARGGHETRFDEIVASVGEEQLIAEARRRGVMRWSGLSDYLRRNKWRRGT